MQKPRRTSRIQREIGQRTPFKSLQQEAALGLLRTADVVRRRVSRVIEPAGITAQQYNVLRILRGSGGEGMPTLDIARRMIEQAPGITRLLDRLEAKQLVRRERCPTDRRQVLCWITDSGRSLLEKLTPGVDKADRDAMAALSLEQLEQLIGLLDTVRDEDA